MLEFGYCPSSRHLDTAFYNVKVRNPSSYYPDYGLLWGRRTTKARTSAASSFQQGFCQAKHKVARFHAREKRVLPKQLSEGSMKSASENSSFATSHWSRQGLSISARRKSILACLISLSTLPAEAAGRV